MNTKAKRNIAYTVLILSSALCMFQTLFALLLGWNLIAGLGLLWFLPILIAGGTIDDINKGDKTPIEA